MLNTYIKNSTNKILLGGYFIVLVICLNIQLHNTKIIIFLNFSIKIYLISKL